MGRPVRGVPQAGQGREGSGGAGPPDRVGTGHMVQLLARKSIAKAGAAFHFSDDFMPVNTAF